MGGKRLRPKCFRCEYQRRLDERIEERSAKIRLGKVDRDAYAVFGIRAFLERLRERGLRLYVLSGTVEHRVREEAELLGVAGYFDGGINGSPSDGDTPFTKMEVMRRILAEESISGDRLASFGDGRIELANTKELGGLAVAVREQRGRQRLRNDGPLEARAAARRGRRSGGGRLPRCGRPDGTHFWVMKPPLDLSKLRVFPLA